MPFPTPITVKCVQYGLFHLQVSVWFHFRHMSLETLFDMRGVIFDTSNWKVFPVCHVSIFGDERSAVCYLSFLDKWPINSSSMAIVFSENTFCKVYYM